MTAIKQQALYVTRELIGTLGKVAIALAVFAAVIVGFDHAVTSRANAMLVRQPLPDQTASSDCAIWFVGSSSMSRWTTLPRDMAPWLTHNRAIGGATLDEINQRFVRDENPQAPQAIVFYAGENDIAFGTSVTKTINAFREFDKRKKERFGNIPLLFVSLKPSPLRWEQREKQRVVNEAIQLIAQNSNDVFFVDMAHRILVNGRPGPFFGDDGLHFNEAGYQILTEEVQNALHADLPAPVVSRCTSAERRV